MLPENSSLSLAGRVALVTAVGQGIGRAVAERLVRDGAEVHASDLDAALLDGLDATSVTAVDATDANAVAAWTAPFRRIDPVVHAVGYVALLSKSYGIPLVG